MTFCERNTAPLAARDADIDRVHPSMALHGARWLRQMLDQIDHGAILLSGEGQALHLNQSARSALAAEHPLQLCGRHVKARQVLDQERLSDGLARARRGQRRLLFIGDAGRRAVVSVVPLESDDVDAPSATLLMLGKRLASEDLSLQCFARAHGLTTAETWVLESICRGLKAAEVAAQRRVSLATVRSHLSAIRGKTGDGSIHQLLCRVAALPPLLGVMRMAG